MAETSKVERVRAVLDGQKPDRPPVSFWHHFDPTRVTGQAAVDAHLAHLETFDVDFLKVMNDHPYPGVGSHPTVAELADLPVWRGDEPGFVEQLEVIASLGRHLKGRVLLATTMFNAWTTLRHHYLPADRPHGPPKMKTAGDKAGEALTKAIQEDRAAVRAALDHVSQSLAHFAAKCIEAGADGVFLSVRDDWVDAPANGGPGTYADLVRAADLRILDAAGAGSFNMLHVCGKPLDFASFAKYPVHVVNWADRAAGPSIGEVIGKTRPAVCGGLDNLRTLPECTPDECAAEVADALRQAGDRPVLIAPGCTYDPDRVPAANLHAVVEAVKARSAT